ncbi:unnamed protein product, partial [Rangifer tarandus platyrhynchus]
MNQIIECSSSEVTVTAHIKARWIKGLKETGRWQKSNPRATTVSGHINYRLQGTEGDRKMAEEQPESHYCVWAHQLQTA